MLELGSQAYKVSGSKYINKCPSKNRVNYFFVAPVLSLYTTELIGLLSFPWRHTIRRTDGVYATPQNIVSTHFN